MLNYIFYRVLIAVPLLIALSIVSFVIIQLPPGDYLTTYITNLKLSGVEVAEDEIARLKELYGLDKPLYVQYLLWIKNFIKGDLGRSFQWNRPVNEILAERVPMTVFVSILATVFTWIVAIPIGTYSALHQYSLFDYAFTFLGYIGLSIPGFLLALILMWFLYDNFGLSVAGLFSPHFATAPWSFAKFIDLLKHIWFPVILIGISGTAGLIRTMRGNLLDELGKQYVVVARAKGLPEREVIFKYPVRMAINPLISTIGWMLPGIISGETLISIVLNIETLGPVLLRAVMSQDMYLAGSITLILSILTVVGVLISDILLVWVDPRIRYGRIGE